MPREAKPYVKNGWYVTSAGGVQHQKLCPVEQGLRQAKIALATLIATKHQPGLQTALGSGVAAMVAPQTASPSVSVAIDEFLNFKKAEKAEATYFWYREKLGPLYQQFGERPINSITPEDGTTYKNWLRHEKEWRRGKAGPVRKGLNTTTVNHHIRAARTLLSWTCKPTRRHRYGMSLQPWQEISQFVENGRERVITDDEFTHLLDNCTNGAVRSAAQDYRETLTVQRLTTMRPQELRKLRWDYVQWDLHRIVFPAKEVKTRKRREIVLIDQVKETLRARQDRLEKLLGRKPNGYVFPLPAKVDGIVTAGAGDQPQKASKFAQRFRRLVERCVKKGLIEKEKAGERIVPYSTRHTRITELFVQKNEQHIVQYDAGHTNPKTTERYKHLAGSFVADTIRQRSQQQVASASADSGGSAAVS